MRKQFPSLAVILAAFALTACSSVGDADSMVATGETKAGKAVLVDGEGRSLYTLNSDIPNESYCMGYCTVMYPPLIAAEGAEPSGEFSVITRAGGDKQWAYKGKALYRYTMDWVAGNAGGTGSSAVSLGLWDAQLASP